MSPKRKIELIEDNETLRNFCAQLSQSAFVTIDTEFIRDRTYWPRLCLIQIANTDVARAIDPLASAINLNPLSDLLTNPNVTKVFHAARQDIEIFIQQNGVIPTPLFDTQIAAMVCGFGDSVGYDRLVENLVGTKIDKGQRYTDWSRRPLNSKQIGYALDDVTYLIKIYEALGKQLKKSGREPWLEEEVTILTNPATYEQFPNKAWRRLKLRSNDAKYLGVAKELAAWREREAQRRNLPRSHVLKDEAILELAAEKPETVKDLSHLRATPKSIAQGPVGRHLLTAIKMGRTLSDNDIPKPEAKVIIPRGLGPLISLMKVLLKTKCDANDVAQKLVASTSDIERIAADDNADVAALRGWRKEIFGKDALDLKHGRLAMSANGKRVQLIRTP